MAETVKGLTVEIGGDVTPLSKALKDVNAVTVGLAKELKSVEKALSFDPTNTEMLAQKQTLLKSAIDETSKKLDILRKAQQDADAQIAAGTEVDQEAYRKVTREIAMTESAIKKYTAEYADCTSESKKLSREIGEQEGELARLRQQYTDATLSQGKNSDSAKALAKQIKELSGELTDNKTALKQAESEADKLDKTVDEAGDSAEKASGGFTVMKGALANMVSSAITAGLQQIARLTKELVTSVLSVGMNFEESMSKVAALSGASGAELEALTETAKKYGASTKFSASQASEALQYMALAGWSATEMTNGLGGVLDLAAASGMDLGAACDIVTDYLGAFGMEAEQSAEMADMMAYAQANANLTTTNLAESWRNCAANLNASGQSVQTTTALLSMMANQGLKGTKAGTALSAVMRDITASMDDGAIKIGETSVAVTDADGNFRDLIDILTEVEAATEGMGTAERATALAATFTADSTKGLNLILNAGTDEAAAFAAELYNTEGAAAAAATTMADNLTGAWTSMKSALEGVQIKLYDTFSGTLKETVLEAIPYVNQIGDGLAGLFSGADGAGEQFSAGISGIVSKVIDLTGKLLPAITATISGVISGILNSITTLAPAIGDAIASLVPALVTMIINTAPSLVTAIMQMATSLISSLATTLPPLLPQLISIVLGVVIELLTNSLPPLLDAVLQLVTGLVEALPEIITMIVDALPEIITSIVSFVIGAIPTLINVIFTDLLPALMGAIPSIVLAIMNALPQIVTAIISVIPMIITALIEATPTIIAAIVEMTPQIIAALLEILIQLPILIWDILVGIVTNIVQWGKEILGAGKEAIGNLVSNVWQKIKEMPGKIWDGIVGAISRVKEWGTNLAKTGLEAAGKLVSKIWETVKALPGKLLDVGKNLVSGLWQGISNSFDWIIGKIKGWVGSVLNWIKKLFGISSPSKLMRDEVGHYLAEGMAEGIADDADAVLGATQGIIDDMNKLGGIDLDRQINTTFGTAGDPAYIAAISIQSSIDRLTEMVGQYLPQLAERVGSDVMLDGKVLVGGIISEIDTQLAQRYSAKARART